LSTAAVLARAGQKVLVLEANTEAVGAGRMGSFQLTDDNSHDCYRFDSGPSLLLLPDVYEAAFDAGGGGALWRGDSSSDRGETSGGGLNVKLVAGPRYAIHFDDGARSPGQLLVKSRWPGGSLEPQRQVEPPLRLWGGLGGFAQDCESFEALELAAGTSGGGAAYARHMVSCQRLLDGGLPNFIAGKFKLKALLQMLGEVLSGSWPLDVQEKLLRKRFKSPKSRAALSFQSLYVGLTPFEAPAIFGLLQPLELGPVPDLQRADPQPPTQGIYYPVGGFGQVADGLVALARGAGAEVRYQAKVQQLLLHGDQGWGSEGRGDGSDGARSGGAEAGAVGGVRVQGPSQAASSSYDVACGAVVLNADAAAAESLLLGPTSRAADARTFDAATLSCSVVAWHLALNRTLAACLAHHSLFLAVDAGGGGGWDDAKARPLDEPRRRAAWAWQARFPSGGEDALEARLGGADAAG
jgi:phytoene desaturase (3,4-didehydrolycopene-forming)